MYALHGILPEDDYKCWSLLVDTCRFLCLPIISEAQTNRDHLLIVEFCQSFQNLYVAESCTLNMHLACRLKDSILDYGPLAAYLLTASKFYLQYICLVDICDSGDDFISSLCKNNEILRAYVGSFSSFDQSQILDRVCFQHIQGLSCNVAPLDATKKNIIALYIL